MAEVVSTSESQGPSKSEIVSAFWDRYKEFGLEYAHQQFEIDTDRNEELIRGLIPELVGAARERGVDLIYFLKEWDVYMEKINASKEESGS